MKQKQKDKLADNLPACAVEFIRLVINKMRYRREVRQDVQAELATHFEDELKACTSDKEKEQKAQQLITDFGDVKLLAVLLRRAKKRCRPLWRTVVARTFQTVGVLIVCFVIYVVWFLTGKPVITTDYVAELNRIVRPVADDSQNAAPLYHKAAELYQEVPQDVSQLLGKKYREAATEEKQLIEKWITDNEETLELVVAGSKKPYYWQEYGNERYPNMMMAIRLPSLSDFRRLARTLRWRAYLRAEQGRYEDTFDDMKACYRFGRHLRGDKSLIEQLVGIAIEAIAVQTIRDIIGKYQIDSVTLATFQQDFEQMIADENFTVSFKFEKLAMYDVIQRCFTEDRFGEGHLSLDGLRLVGSVTDSELFEFILEGKHWTTPLHVLFTHPNKQESREMVDRCYAFWDKIAQKTPAQIRAEGIDTEKEAMEIIKGNILLEILTPAIGRVCEIAHRNRIDVEATLAVIAILRYKEDVGDYPENLDELIEAGLLKALPIDPYSDQPLVYKGTESDFVLYGVGENFKDDGGTVAVIGGRLRKWGTKEEGDWIFWPVPE